LTSIALNILVILTFLKQRKTDKKLALGGVHLLVLAFTDTAASLVWVLGFVFCLMVENNHLSKDSFFFAILSGFMFSTVFTNRFLTLYIAFTGARVMWSLSQALRYQHKTEKDHFQDTIYSGLFALLVGIAIAIAIEKFENPRVCHTGFNSTVKHVNFQTFHVVGFFLILCCIVVKMRRLRLDAAVKVMKKNVAVVAIVHCICLMPAMGQYGELAFSTNCENSHIISTEVVSSFHVLNSGIDIFIYITFGEEFRMVLFNILTEYWQSQRGEISGSMKWGSLGEINGTQGNYREFVGSTLAVARVVLEGRESGAVSETIL
jgi:hypothetical protein